MAAVFPAQPEPMMTTSRMGMWVEIQGSTREERLTPPGKSRGLKTLVDLLLTDRASLDHAPCGLGDIDRGGAWSRANAAIEHQVHAAIHHAEDVDGAAAGGVSGNVGAGRD